MADPRNLSSAYQHYAQRPKSEFSKLLYLIDRLRENNFEVVYNGRCYQTRPLGSLIKQYLFLNYKNEKAEHWILQHAYRSQTRSCIIYLKDPTGNSLVLKDVLLEELNTLPQA